MRAIQRSSAALQTELPITTRAGPHEPAWNWGTAAKGRRIRAPLRYPAWRKDLTPFLYGLTSRADDKTPISDLEALSSAERSEILSRRYFPPIPSGAATPTKGAKAGTKVAAIVTDAVIAKSLYFD